jgi:hypothetical protein
MCAQFFSYTGEVDPSDHPKLLINVILVSITYRSSNKLHFRFLSLTYDNIVFSSKIVYVSRLMKCIKL